jgi:hypothetical protein
MWLACMVGFSVVVTIRLLSSSYWLDPAKGAGAGSCRAQAASSYLTREPTADSWAANCSALTSLKYEDERFENVSMEFDEARLAPTYRLLWGIPGRSNALNIAQRLGLDRGVVASARERLGNAEVRPFFSVVLWYHLAGAVMGHREMNNMRGI